MNWYKQAQLQSRSVTVQNMGWGSEMVPILMLRGKWLMEAGFYPHDKVNVAVSENPITLSVAQRSEDSRVKHQQQIQYKEQVREKRKQDMLREDRIPYPTYR